MEKAFNSMLKLFTTLLILSICYTQLSFGATSDLVTFEDDHLEQALCTKLGKLPGEITVGDLEGLQTLDLSHTNISDITGLEHAVNLRTLVLNNNNISDISPLSSLVNLATLYLDNNNIRSIEPLSEMHNLVYLYLQNNDIVNIETIENLDNLRDLYILQNQIRDLSPIAEATSLEKVYAQYNLIRVIPAPGANNNITTLVLSHNLITESNPISSYALISGNKYELDNNYLGTTDFSDMIALFESFGVTLKMNNQETPQAMVFSDSDFEEQVVQTVFGDQTGTLLDVDMFALQSLYLSNCSLSDITTASNLLSLKIDGAIRNMNKIPVLAKLEELDCNNISVMDYSILTDLEQLKVLKLNKNNIEDISFLGNYSELEELSLKGNLISNLSPLSSLLNLKILDLRTNDITDITPLSNLTKLKTLLLGTNCISNINSLSSLINLETLGLAANEIENISVLEDLKNLKKIDVGVNKVRNIDVLIHCQELETVYIDYNLIEDISVLESLPDLTEVWLEYNYLNLDEGEDLITVTNLTDVISDTRVQKYINHADGMTTADVIPVKNIYGNTVNWSDADNVYNYISDSNIDLLDIIEVLKMSE